MRRRGLALLFSRHIPRHCLGPQDRYVGRVQALRLVQHPEPHDRRDDQILHHRIDKGQRLIHFCKILTALEEIHQPKAAKL